MQRYDKSNNQKVDGAFSMTLKRVPVWCQCMSFMRGNDDSCSWVTRMMICRPLPHCACSKLAALPLAKRYKRATIHCISTFCLGSNIKMATVFAKSTKIATSVAGQRSAVPKVHTLSLALHAMISQLKSVFLARRSLMGQACEMGLSSLFRPLAGPSPPR